MKKLRKVLSAAMAAAMITTAFAGCNQSSSGGGSSAGGSAPAANTAKVSLKWYSACSSGPQADIKTVQDAIDKYLMDKYKMNVDLQIIMSDFSSYTDKMQMIIGGGEEYDICWTANWSNNYLNNVNKNAFVDLDTLLDKDAPELKASMKKEYWDAARVNGKLYGVPNQQIFANQNYMTVVKDYADKYGLDTSKVSHLSDLDDFFTKVKKDNPSVYPMAASSNGVLTKIPLSYGFDAVGGVKIPGAVNVNDSSLTVVNQFELPEVKAHYELMHKWSQAGIVKQDAATVTENGVPDMKAGINIASVNATFKPGVEVTEKGNFGGKEVKFAMLSDKWLTTNALTSSLNAISRTSKNPDTAMKLLNYVNTDADLYNLFCFGVEGTHYNKNADGTVKAVANAGYNPDADWTFGNQFNGYLREGQDKNTWEETKKINDSAKASPALGFSFDSTPVTNEIASVTSVVSQYQLSLDTGAADPAATYDEFIKKLKAAGSEKIIAEMQKQINTWKATKSTSK